LKFLLLSYGDFYSFAMLHELYFKLGATIRMQRGSK